VSEKQDHSLGNAILYTVARNAGDFRYHHACVLVGLTVAVLGALIGEPWGWFPRWQVYVLVVCLSADALMHARLNQQIVSDQRQEWERVLSLAISFHQNTAGNDDGSGRADGGTNESEPMLRLVQPNQEASHGEG
jgi:hypothetical protein